ncbi:hypothetical protein PGTUg99_028338 [Puccinia graminis f. sp. tritici]|uniref:Uncharacterized protein n=1 Tax=Puccinia graminis f. sp. tritici TaxID=56615 RepID=A0A5B0RPU3_PUCGR|nr:hypothetical protein PGTUg99_028338 [Puccinia graminis f. sp. tritici]
MSIGQLAVERSDSQSDQDQVASELRTDSEPGDWDNAIIKHSHAIVEHQTIFQVLVISLDGQLTRTLRRPSDEFFDLSPA